MTFLIVIKTAINNTVVILKDILSYMMKWGQIHLIVSETGVNNSYPVTVYIGMQGMLDMFDKKWWMTVTLLWCLLAQWLLSGKSENRMGGWLPFRNSYIY